MRHAEVEEQVEVEGEALYPEDGAEVSSDQRPYCCCKRSIASMTHLASRKDSNEPNISPAVKQKSKSDSTTGQRKICVP